MSSPNTYAAALQGSAPGRRPTAASRQGRKHVDVYVAPDVAHCLRVLAAVENTTTQRLIEEGIELVFPAVVCAASSPLVLRDFARLGSGARSVSGGAAAR